MDHNPPQPRVGVNTGTAVSFMEAAALVAAKAAEILAYAPGDPQPCELSRTLGRVLASAVVADRDQPPFARVTRDGFAVRARDVSKGGSLRVTGELRAGEPWLASRAALLPGEAIEIMTGAALPPGADAVLMVEHAEEISTSSKGGGAAEHLAQRLILLRPGRTLVAGENVIPQGSEAQRGDILLEAGTRLLPDQAALAASCGCRSVLVYPPPKVAILATGDELVQASAGCEAENDPATHIEPHQIYDSNTHGLAALVTQAGAIPLPQPVARDTKHELMDRVRHALKVAPLLLLTGGVSMGRYDLVEGVLADLGAEFFFTGVKMQPGKPVVFGRVPCGEGLPWRFFFGLPGNPVSTMVTFRVFVEPLLAALSGDQHWQPRTALAILSSEVQSKPGLTRFLPAILDTVPLEPVVTPIRNQGSGDLAANARANCYCIVPDGCELLKAQQPVRVLLR